MDPVGAFLIAVLIATAVVRRWFGDGIDYLRGNGTPRHERLMAERAQEHERRRAAQDHRHAERMAGQGFPTFGESVGAGLGKRLANGPLPYDRRHPLRRWWWDRCEDWAADDARRRQESADRTARGEQWWQQAGEAARRRARRYWQDNIDPGRARRRRRDGVQDAEWWENDPEPAPPGPDPQPSTPGDEGGHTTSRPQPEPTVQRPGPVWATAERLDDQPASREPSGPPPALTQSDQDPAGVLEAAPIEEGETMSALVPITRAALGREARSAARHHPVAKTFRGEVGTKLDQAVGGYSVGEVNDAVALAAGWVVALRDKLDDLYSDLADQKISGEGMRQLRGAVNDLASAVTELHGSKGGFEFKERVLEDVGQALQQAGIGSVRGSFARDHIR